MNRTLLSIFVIADILFSQSVQTIPIADIGSSSQSATLLNINRMSAWYESNGSENNHPATGNPGLTYPRATSTAIYSAGLLWGGYVNDGAMAINIPRVNGNSYNSGMTPGAIIGVKTGMTEDPAAADVRMFRIRKDYVTADLKQDAAELNSIAITEVDTSHINAARAQYLKDWIEWPAAKGAPFYDANNDGKYSPKFDAQQNPVLYPNADEPGIAGADQVIWYVANDIRGGDSPWKTKPIGLEMQVTIWGYNYASNHGLGNTIFKRNRLIYKGTAMTPDSARMSEFYIGQWSDPDVGDAGDDFAGCDSILNAGYAYNSITQDQEYAKFGIAPPSIGYILLQGPIVKGHSENYARYDFGWKQSFKNLPATSFVPFSAGNFFDCQEPPFGYEQGLTFYYNLRGLPSFPIGPPDPPPFIDPVTKKPTKFVVSGDPVNNSGWVDGKMEENTYGCHVSSPGDRRMLLSSGPFEMKLGETQEVIYALAGAVGSDRLASITAMKFFMKQSKEYFNYLFPDNPNSVGSEGVSAGNFQLFQNYPNPFNPITTISYQLSTSSFTSLKIYDILGREVATLVYESMDAGAHTVLFDASGLTSGMYVARLTNGTNVQMKKLLLLK